MNAKEIFLQLVQVFPGVKVDLLEPGEEIAPNVKRGGDPYIVVPQDQMGKVLDMLRHLDIFSFNCLMNLTAVDYADRMEVIYNLFSYKRHHKIQVKVKLARNEYVEVPSVTGLWKSADWLEREVYDLFGIYFTGHQNLKRIMLPDDWKGHPLRKDYKEEASYQGMETTRGPLV